MSKHVIDKFVSKSLPIIYNSRVSETEVIAVNVNLGSRKKL